MIWNNMLIGAVVKKRAPAFTLSGSWETNFEGWVLASMVRSTTLSRTGSYSLAINAGSGSATLTLPMEQVFGLNLTFSVYSRMNTGTGTRTISYQIGAGAFTTLQSVNNSSVTFALLSGNFSNPGENSVTFRIQGEVFGCSFDDWTITGS